MNKRHFLLYIKLADDFFYQVVNSLKLMSVSIFKTLNKKNFNFALKKLI